MHEIAAVVERTETTGIAADAGSRRAGRRPAGRRPADPGFGHRQHKRRDPRLDRLLAVASEAGVAGDHVAAALAIEASLTRRVGRPMPINIDGVIAADPRRGRLSERPRQRRVHRLPARRDPRPRQRGTPDDDADAADRSRSTTRTAAPPPSGRDHTRCRSAAMTRHPTAAEQLVGYLERRGVRHVFGLCGHTNIAVLAAMADSSIEFVNVRHEQVAAHAADGYARVTGRASVVLSHLSPGLTNAATGVANAALDCIPMVVIAGDVPVALLRPAPAPGGQPARRRRAVRDLPTVRQAGLAGRQGRAAPRDHREGVPARRERPARPGARRRADGRLLAARRPGAVRPPRPRHQDVAPAVARRRDRQRRSSPASPRPSARSSTPAAVCCCRGRATSCGASSTTWASRSPTA